MFDPMDPDSRETGAQPPPGERPLRLEPEVVAEQLRLAAPPAESAAAEPVGEAPPELRPPPPPLASEAPGQAEMREPAWERLEEVGVFASLFATIKQVLFEPDEAFARMPREPRLGRPLLFAVLLGTVAAMLTTSYWLILQAHPSLLGQGGAGAAETPFEEVFKALGLEAPDRAQLVLLRMLLLVLAPLGAVLEAFIWAGVVHLFLTFLNAANRPFAATFRTLCYVQGATAILAIIPGGGALLGAAWGMAISIIGLRKTQEIGSGKAAAAVLLPLVFCFCCAGLGTHFVGSGLPGWLQAAAP